jgi:hypothetical protein
MIASRATVACLAGIFLLAGRHAAAQNNAEIQPASSSVPGAIAPGGTATVRIHVRNNGTTTWKAGTNHRLGAQYTGTLNQISWSGFPCGGYMTGPTDGRIFLCNDVAPGASYDFSFNVSAAANATGSLTLSVRMVQDGVQWFGSAAAWTLAVQSINDAEIQAAASSVPPTVAAGATAPVRVRVRNVGSTTWRAATGHRLGAVYTGTGSNQLTWSAFPCGGYMTKPSDGRVFLCNDVVPGATYDFLFNVTAPASASGSVRLGVRMVQDGVQWFGGQYAWALTIPVVDTAPPTAAITAPTTGASYCSSVSQLPISGTASDDVGVTSVTWRNAATGETGTASGTTAWSASVRLAPNGNQITVTAIDATGKQGTDSFTADYTPADTAPPAIAISTPTAQPTFTTTSTPLTLSGTASDNVGIASVTWKNDVNGATGTASGTTAWSASVPLASGENRLTVTARDAAGNPRTASLVVDFDDSRGISRISDAPTVPLSYGQGSGLAPALATGRVYGDLAANAPARMRDLAALGVRIIRIEIENATAPGEYQAIVAAAQAAGIEVLALVTSNSMAPGSPSPMQGDMTFFDQQFVPAYIQAIDNVTAMLPTVKYVEVWNEPDVYGFTPMYNWNGSCVILEGANRYALLATRVFETIHQRRLSGATTPLLAAFSVSRQDDSCLRKGLFDSTAVYNHRRFYRVPNGLPDGLPADIVAIHGYGNGGKAPDETGYTYPFGTFPQGGTFADGVTDYLNARFADNKSVINQTPVWYTEVGYSWSQLGAPRQVGALRYVFSTLASHPQVTALFWYDYRDDEHVSCQVGERFGLRDEASTGFAPHLSYPAYQETSVGLGDVTAPAGAITGPPTGGVYPAGGAIAVSGWAIDASGNAPIVEITLAGNVVASVMDGGTPSPTACVEAYSTRCPAVGFTRTINAPPTAGTYEIAVRARDASGNVRVVGRVDIVVQGSLALRRPLSRRR